MAARNLIGVLCCILVIGCGPQEPTSKESATPVQNVKPRQLTFDPEVTTLENGESSHITVQHVLIGFRGSLPGKNITRSKDEAKKLANEILEKAKAGEDFDQLVIDYTDDSPPGIYKMANFGQQSFMTPRSPQDRVYPRGQMVSAFGDVGFPLEVGGFGMSEYDRNASPYGWHIIKRLK